jgi:hypothetical protein
MKKEPLSFSLQINLTRRQREALQVEAEKRGATISGVVRRLIEDAFSSPASPVGANIGGKDERDAIAR